MYNLKILWRFNILMIFLLMVGCSGFKSLSRSDQTTAEKSTAALEPQLTPDGEPILMEAVLVPNLGSAEQLTSGAYDNGIASWHPDGNRIVFQSDRDGRWQLFELDLGLGLTSQILESETIDENPVWSSNGQDLLFVSRAANEPEWEHDINVFNPFANIVLPIAKGLGDDWFPVTYSDQRFLFLSERDSDLELPEHLRKNSLYLGNLDGSTPELLFDFSYDFRTPTLVDTNQILVLNSRNNLVLANPTQSKQTVLTPSQFECRTPTYDSKSGLIAFPARLDHAEYLIFYNLKQFTYQKLDLGLSKIRYPRFSPDGKWLLLSAEVEDHFHLFRISLGID